MQAKMIERMVADLRAQSYRRDAPAGDAELMDAFLARRDQAAFAALVQRHGPMVLGVCRRILGHVQDSEDAFQAAFWVLARKANTVRPRTQVGNWLYGVAVRTALKARGLRRRRREHQVTAMPPQTVAPGENNFDVQALLDEEIERLPQKYRLAVVLCELEGRSRTDAAAQLRIAEGTLSSRLAHARKVLARRLQARGVTLAAGGLALGGAAVPQTLLASAVQAATATSPASATVSLLVKGVMTAMFLSKLKQMTAITLVGALILGIGAGSRSLWSKAGADEPVLAKNEVQTRKPAPPKGGAPVQPGKTDPSPSEGILGVWRVLRIETRPQLGGEGAGGEGGGAGLAGAGPPGPVGPRGAGPMMPGMGAGGASSTVYDGANGKAFLNISKDEATFTSRTQRVTYQFKSGQGGGADMRAGTIDLREQADDTSTTLLGVYLLDGNHLQLYFGPNQIDRQGNAPPGPKSMRPKGPKDAIETWTLVRPPTRQQIYQRLDQLQGIWRATAGAYNGEALLPRELKPVVLTIGQGHWNMSPPSQPGQPDAVPRRFFSRGLEFVLDAEGPRSYLMLQNVSKSGEVRVLYELRGNELKVCWSTRWPAEGARWPGPAGFTGRGAVGGDNVEAPTEFKTAPGSDLVLFVLRRQGTEPDSGTADGPMGAAGNPPPQSPAGTPETVADAKHVVKVVPAADLVSRDGPFEGTNLIQVITRTVEPSSWDSNGGNGTIEYFAEGRSLVINQTPEIHARIAALLSEMRQAKVQQEKK